MDKKEYQQKTIDSLVRHEEAIAELYNSYSDKFLGFRDFWLGIVADEKSHASWIRTLYKKTEGGLADFSQNRFPLDAIEDSKKFLEQKKIESSKGEISLVYALETAANIEQGMLEKKFFEIFKDDALELQIILEALRLGTQQHFEHIKKAWEKEKNGL